MSSTAPPAATARRGLLLLTFAKLWFMVGGAALTLALPRMFPRALSAERYGEWSLVLACMSLLNNVIVTGTIFMVSRFAARGPEWIEGTKRAALRTNAVLVGVVALGYIAAAPAIAAFEKNPALVDLLRLSAGVPVCYGLYAVFVGAANGNQDFLKQAGLDVTFTTLRAVLVLGAAAVFSSVAAAVGGFVLAAATILVLSVLVVGWRPVAQRPTVGELLAFAAPVAAYQLVQNLTMFADLWLVERYVALGAETAGSVGAAATVIANRAAGAYNGALSVARLPFQATIAVTLVMFPMISRATFADDRAQAAGIVKSSVRLSLIVVAAAVAAVAARPDSIFLILFPRNAAGVNEYLAGAGALPPLMFAYGAFALLGIAANILNASGSAALALGVGLVTLTVDVAANLGAIRWALATHGDALFAAGAATAVAMITGLGLSLAALQHRFGASLDGKTAARVALSTALGIAAGRALPIPGKAGLVGCVVGALLYALAVVASGELSVGELRRLSRRGR